LICTSGNSPCSSVNNLMARSYPVSVPGAPLNAAPARTSEAATADDTARFLAGLPPSSNSPLAALTKDPPWLSHARYFDSIFAREESAQLSKVREFSKKYLTDKHDTMVYMFSGPDFLYATRSSPTPRRTFWPVSNQWARTRT
jgi:hypothetical protein